LTDKPEFYAVQVNFIEKMRYSLRASDPQEGIPPSRGPVALILPLVRVFRWWLPARALFYYAPTTNFNRIKRRGGGLRRQERKRSAAES